MRRKERRDPTLMSKLIMVVAFDPDEHGNLQPILSPTEPQSEECAIRTAVALSAKYPDVVAWSRQADAAGKYGSPTVLFRTPQPSGDSDRGYVQGSESRLTKSSQRRAATSWGRD